MISHTRLGPPVYVFQRATLKNWVWPGDEATSSALYIDEPFQNYLSNVLFRLSSAEGLREIVSCPGNAVK